MTDTYLNNHGMAVQLIARQEGLIERLRGELREAADEIERLRGLLAWHDSTVPEILADNTRLRAKLAEMDVTSNG